MIYVATLSVIRRWALREHLNRPAFLGGFQTTMKLRLNDCSAHQQSLAFFELNDCNQPEAGSHAALMIGSCWSNAAGHKQQTGQGVSSLGSCAPGLIRIRSLTKTGRFTCWQNFLSDHV